MCDQRAEQNLGDEMVGNLQQVLVGRGALCELGHRHLVRALPSSIQHALHRLDNLLDQFRDPPKVFILRMRLVPIVDSSGVHALKTLLERCRRRGIVLVISGLQPQPRRVIEQMQLHPRDGDLYFASDFEAALRIADRLLGHISP